VQPPGGLALLRKQYRRGAAFEEVKARTSHTDMVTESVGQTARKAGERGRNRTYNLLIKSRRV
jgi:hypothetical protein